MANLSLQQSLLLKHVEVESEKWTREDLRKEYLDLLKTMMIKENSYQQFILESAGIVTPIYEDGNK